MRKLYLLPVLILFVVSANAQSIIDTTKMWAVNTQDCFQFYGSTNYYKIGDTITISPYLYNEVFYASDSNYTNWINYGYIRQEQEKYFYLNDTGNVEGLLYDFDVIVGDTMQHFGMNFYVFSVDSVFFAGQVRKRIKLYDYDTLFYETWYSGIGSDQGLLESFLAFIVGGDYELQCYWENEILLYHNPMFVDCWDYTKINKNKYTSFTVYPNPTTGKITIENSEYSIQNISVFDIYGREVLKSENVTLRDSKCELDLSQQPKGIYFVKLNTEEGVRVEKIIKNEKLRMKN